MSFDPQSADKQAWSNELSSYLEHLGFPPVTGRILTQLLICDPPEQSSAQLGESCQASKGAVSTATRALMQFGLVERLRKPGDRAAYFRLREDAWSYLIHAELVKARTLLSLSEQGMALMGDASPDQTRRLREFCELQRFMVSELPPLIERWDTIWKEKS